MDRENKKIRKLENENTQTRGKLGNIDGNLNEVWAAISEIDGALTQALIDIGDIQEYLWG